MDISKTWNKALKNTEIIRTRVQALMTFSNTLVPYIVLCESTIKPGDTVVRKCEVMVEKPSLILPPNLPQFEGFEFEKEFLEDENSLINFLLVRGVSFPSMKYNNKTLSLDIYEGKLKDAIGFYLDQLQQEENVATGLITGPEDCWQFSVLIFIAAQITKNADTDVKRLLEEYRKKNFL